MTTTTTNDDNASLFTMPSPFSRLFSKPILAGFDGGALTSDAGVVLLSAAAAQVGFADRLASLIPDARRPDRVIHDYSSQILSRIFAICAGYEDGNDLTKLRHDPAFRVALGREPQSGHTLCSQSTISRFENAPDKASLRAMHRLLIDLYCERREAANGGKPPNSITLDIDETPDAVHGAGAQLALFNGHYGMNCFLPIHIYELETGYPVGMLLRTGAPPSGKEIRVIMRFVVRNIRRHWPDVTIHWRGDARYAAPEVMTFLEQSNCDYTFGLTPNARVRVLFAQAGDAVKVRRVEEVGPEGTLRDFAEAQYAARSWKDPDCPTQLRTRRVIARMEASPHGYDLRCIVTSTKTAPAILYESIYCQRGEAENLIKLHKTQLASDRTSCETPEANQFRLILHTLAYWTMITLREAIPEGMAERRAQFETLRLKLIKVAARVVEMKTRIRFYLSQHCLSADLLRMLCARLAEP